MRVVRTFAAARDVRSGIVGLVPTMGYLHEGHLALVRAAAEGARTVVVSLFVNPLQFDDADDLGRYPRDADRDAELAEDAGADVFFAPDLEEMYPVEPVTRVRLDPLTDTMEGAHRPGHFDGVATVVAKLFAGIRPDRAWFGRKDAQQFVVLRRMAADLSFPVEVLAHPVVREPDGLALSSRNVFLSGADRAAAVGLSRGLFAAADDAAAGERSGAALERRVADAVREAGAELEYATLASRDDCSILPALDRPAFLAVAARVGAVRLIDNVWLEPDGSVDRGERLTERSVLYERRDD
ncbi:MAG: pantoate--beta-alanine ligase [Acidimicrobiia bacterium]|nr:pantoate--beta-alanine ligase [Acidimicrobiia bacterium]